jgi:hypothetical protein
MFTMRPELRDAHPRHEGLRQYHRGAERYRGYVLHIVYGRVFEQRRPVRTRVVDEIAHGKFRCDLPCEHPGGLVIGKVDLAEMQVRML